MAIKSGIGFGEAQVFDSSSLVNTYAKLLAQQQKEQQKYQSELADIMATVKTDGVRDADKPIVANTYNEIKKLYSEAVNNKDPQQRALNRSLIKEKISSLNEYSARSNQFAKEYKTFTGQIIPNIWKYDAKKIDELKSMANKSLMELGEKAVIDPFYYQPAMDDSVRDKVQNDIYKQEEKRIGPKDYVKQTIAGTGERYVGVGKKDRVIADITTKLATSPEYKALAYSQYVDMNPGVISPKPEDIIANELKIYEQKFGYNYEGSISRIPKGRSGGSSDDEKLTYRQQLISGLVNKDTKSKDELLANLPSGAKVTFGVSRAVPGKSKGGYSFMKLYVPGESTEDGIEVNEVIPLQATNTVQRLNYFINRYSPEKISPSKVGIAGGKPRGEKFEVNAPKGKKYSPVQEKAIAQAIKDNPGVSRDVIIKALGL